MKIVIAPDSFKESLNAADVCVAIEAGFKKQFPDAEYVHVPIADGGEGTIEALTAAHDGYFKSYTVMGPDGNDVQARIGYSADGQKAFIEMAEASGIHLVKPALRNPLTATTYGTGQLLQEAINQGATNIILGIGGSATNDGGAGLAMALGFELLDANSHPIALGGAALKDLASIRLDNRLAALDTVKIAIACDVDNPLLGSQGATAVYGPQKSVNAETQIILESALAHYNTMAELATGKSVANIAGSGAAGGLGAGLLFFTQARLRKGIDIVLEEVALANICQDADLVITGEGRMDGQTIYGKAPIGVARVVPTGIPVVAICGSLGTGFEAVYSHGITAAFATIPTVDSLENTLKNARSNVETVSESVARILKIGRTNT